MRGQPTSCVTPSAAARFFICGMPTATAKAASFQLQQFHNEFLSYGGLPVSLIRWGMGLGIDE